MGRTKNQPSGSTSEGDVAPKTTTRRKRKTTAKAVEAETSGGSNGSVNVTSVLQQMAEQNKALTDIPNAMSKQADSFQAMTEAINSMTRIMQSQYDLGNENDKDNPEFDDDPYDLLINTPALHPRNLDVEQTDEHECETGLNEDILTILSQTDPPLDYGDNISEDVARSFSKIPNQRQNVDMLDKLKKSHKVPGNCKEIGVPKINPELWSQLGQTTKASDAKLQQLQQHLSRSLVAQAKLADQIIMLSSALPKESTQQCLKTLMDSAMCCGFAIQDINWKRKQNLKPSLQSEYAGLCVTFLPVSEYLFGDNLEQSLKNVKGSSKIVKSAFTRDTRYSPNINTRGRGRGYPTQNLNFRGRPFRGRGGNRVYKSQQQNNGYYKPQDQRKMLPSKNQ